MVVAAGLHFGHDSGVARVGALGVERYAAKERTSRVKHAIGLSEEDLDSVLVGCDVVGLSSTPDVPIPLLPEIGIEIEGSTGARYAEWVAQTWDHYRLYLRWWGATAPPRGLLVDDEAFRLPAPGRLTAQSGVEDFLRFRSALVRSATTHHRGRPIRSYFFAHHLLHAEYASFTLGDPEGTLVVTCDGGWGPSFQGGGIFYSGEKLRAVVPLDSVDAWVGQFYQSVGRCLGLGDDGSGKLMGLAAYGRPIYADRRLVGKRSEVLSNFGLSAAGRYEPVNELTDRWLTEATGAAEHGWDRAKEVPPELVADIAASAQLLVEQNQLMTCRRALVLARELELPVRKLLLSGGVALNCPANSRIAAALDLEVDCPPGVNDEGLCIAAAVAAIAEAGGEYPASPKGIADAVFLGHAADGAATLGEASKAQYELLASPGGPALATAAQRLRAGEIVALFVGRSEVGPRALGHRSLLADATDFRQWLNVNRVKGREVWRPLAPAVLEADWQEFFDGIPNRSRFMLFNYRVLTRSIPAVTHFDLTARAQVVSPEHGLLHDLLTAFKAVSGVGVLVNTSFNGPGRPIVETAADAFAEARQLGIPLVLTEAGLFRRTTIDRKDDSHATAAPRRGFRWPWQARQAVRRADGDAL